MKNLKRVFLVLLDHYKYQKKGTLKDGIKRINRSLIIVVDSEVFDIKLFINLVLIKDVIMDLHFDVRNRRIK